MTSLPARAAALAVSTAAVIALAATVSACSSSDEDASARQPDGAANRVIELTCSERSDPLGGDRVSGDSDAMVGGMVLYNVQALSVQVPAESAHGDKRWGALKLGVGVPSRAQMAIRVPARDRGSVGLLFRGVPTRGDHLYRISDLAREVRFEGCPANTPRLGQEDGVGVGPITGFVGGVVTTGPRCIRFEVERLGDPTSTREIAFPVSGATCS